MRMRSNCRVREWIWGMISLGGNGEESKYHHHSSVKAWFQNDTFIKA